VLVKLFLLLLAGVALAGCVSSSSEEGGMTWGGSTSESARITDREWK